MDMQKIIITLRDSLLTTVFAGTCDFYTCLAQPSLLGLVLAATSLAVTQKSETADSETSLAGGPKAT